MKNDNVELKILSVIPAKAGIQERAVKTYLLFALNTQGRYDTNLEEKNIFLPRG